MKKDLKWAGSTVGEPWWIVGDITRRLLEPQGYSVEVLTQSAADENPRFVGRGKADFGVVVEQIVGWAVKGEHNFTGEEFVPLRAIARLSRPAWLGVAARHELGFTSMAELAASDYPLRVETHAWDSIGSLLHRKLLAHHGLTKEAIEARGGSLRNFGKGGDLRAGDVDLIVANLYLGRTAVTKHWMTASEHMNLRFFDIDDALLQQYIAEGNGKAGEIPFHFLRGVERPVKALEREFGLIIYCPADLDEDFVHDLTKLYDNNRDMFFNQSLHMAWDPGRVATTNPPLDLHPGAERYYREVGIL